MNFGSLGEILLVWIDKKKPGLEKSSRAPKAVRSVLF